MSTNTFRTIEELIKALNQEQLLLKEMFAKRKSLSFQYDYAQALIDYKEERILYNTALRPRLDETSAGTSLFGVVLDLNAIETEVRTPEEYQQEKETFEVELKESKRTLSKWMTEKEEQVEALEKKYSKRIREIKNEMHSIEAERMKIPSRLKNQQADRNSYISKGEKAKEKAGLSIREKQNEIAHRNIQASQELNKLRDDRERKLKACQKEHREAKEKSQRELNIFLQEIKQEIAGKAKRVSRQPVPSPP